MLSITGLILIVIQFVIDGYAIYHGGQEFFSVLDILSFFLFGIIGVVLLSIDRAWLRHIIEKFRRKMENER